MKAEGRSGWPSHGCEEHPSLGGGSRRRLAPCSRRLQAVPQKLVARGGENTFLQVDNQPLVLLPLEELVKMLQVL
jgi:hypothetical protein